MHASTNTMQWRFYGGANRALDPPGQDLAPPRNFRANWAKLNCKFAVEIIIHDLMTNMTLNKLQTRLPITDQLPVGVTKRIPYHTYLIH